VGDDLRWQGQTEGRRPFDHWPRDPRARAAAVLTQNRSRTRAPGSVAALRIEGSLLVLCYLAITDW